MRTKATGPSGVKPFYCFVYNGQYGGRYEKKENVLFRNSNYNSNDIFKRLRQVGRTGKCRSDRDGKRGKHSGKDGEFSS